MATKGAKNVFNGERSDYEGALVLTDGITVNVELMEDLEIEYADGAPDSISGGKIKITLFDNVSGSKLKPASPTVSGGALFITAGLNEG